MKKEPRDKFYGQTVEEWIEYGDTAGEISEAIITEWRDSGREPDVGDVWFALPHILEATLPPNEPWKRNEDLS